ncbi:aminoglycoside phosphotransferase family protein [Halobacillus sp. B23F22_1]|uniref:aminoglycoside phosphotransferase family protein n=1 Tax=Halobacillus sp. B23F22_1 TaxID=3459514 RepID=UPI00373ECE1F
MNLPQTFVENVVAACPDKGRAWLDELPKLLHYCEERWSLTIHAPFSLSYNYVAPATTNNGKNVVIKLSLPEEGFEREALLALNPLGRINLLDEDREKNILLLERVMPGTPLAEVKDDEAATYIAAFVMKNLESVKYSNLQLPTTEDREDQLRKLYLDSSRTTGPISRGTIKEGLEVFTYLNKKMTRPMVLHGDFHHYNILKEGASEWTTIDPKGLIGEIEYDLIQFLLNRLPDQNRGNCIKKRVEIFEKELHINKEKLLLWGYCHTILAASWTVDQHTGTYDESFFGCIEIFRSLFENTYNQSIMGAVR